MKNLILIWAILFSSMAYAFPPVGAVGQSQTSTIYPVVNKVPYSQVTSLGAGKVLIETGNENMLVNPGFEAVSTGGTPTGWTCTTGTCTTETTIFSSGKQAMKVVPSSNVFDISQQVTTPANIQKQGAVGIIYNIPATCTTAQIEAKVDGTSQTIVPVTSLVIDGLFHSIEVPVVFGATSATIRSFSTATCTGNIYFDAAYVKQGIGTQNLMLDNVYSAQVVTTSGAVSNPSKPGWVSCSAANPTVCTFATGIFTVAPNCTATVSGGGSYVMGVNAASSTSVTIGSYLSSTTAAAASQPFTLTCEKQGNDYLSSSSAVYSQSSANYSRRTFTPSSYQGIGTPSSVMCYESRQGEYDEIECSMTVGTTNGSEVQIGLPTGLTSSALISTLQSAGTWGRAGASAEFDTVTIEPSKTYMTFTKASVGTGSLTKITGSGILSNEGIILHARVPIAGWSNSSLIVGTFAGTPKVPGLDGNVDTFSVSYGTTNATTACSASSCSYLDQIGTAVSSIARNSIGDYTPSFSKTYSKLKCNLSSLRSATGLTFQVVGGGGSCSNCSSLNFKTYDTGGTLADTFGTLTCQGTY